MPSRLQETLKEKVKVRLRSSQKLVSRDVQIHLAEKLADEPPFQAEKVVQIEILKNDEGGAPTDSAEVQGTGEKILLPLSHVADVKVKNFVEKLVNVYVVSITCDLADGSGGSNPVQYFLEFDSAEKRDDWGNGLRSLYHAHQWVNKRTEAKSDLRKLHLIKAINLQLPRPGCILSMEIETAAGRKAPLDVEDKKDKYSSEKCKELTQDFVMQNFIVPAEGASLYRFIRSVISRMLMERETNTIISEIDTQRFNKILENHRSAEHAEVRKVLRVAEAQLRELAGAVPDRIGRHGPASQLLVDILLRSIEKTKIYNRMAFAVNYGQSGEELEF